MRGRGSPSARLGVPAALLAVLAGACARNLDLRWRLTTRLDLTLEYPVTGDRVDFGTVCLGAQSLLVTLETGLGMYTVVTGTDGRLYGCGAAGGADALPCPDGTDLAAAIPAPTRVSIDGITLAPDAYRDAAPSYDVVCRGVADAGLGTGAIAVDVSAGTARETLSIEVAMLRVGDVNGTFSADGPSARFGAAAEIPSPAGRAPDGGTIVFGGGFDETVGPVADVWVFDPRAIAFTRAGSLSQARDALSATAVLDAFGAPAVLFAGGLDAQGAQTQAAELFRLDGSAPEGLSLLQPRAFHAAVPLSSGAGEPDVVALLGGSDRDGANGRSDYELFYSSVPAGVADCSAQPGSAGFCDPNDALPEGRTAEPHGRAVAVALDATRAYLAGGFAGVETLAGTGWIFDATNGGTFTAADALPIAVRDAAIASLDGGVGAWFGGYQGPDADPQASDAWTYDAGAPAVGTGNANVPRGLHTATTLFDRRILLAGGSGDGTLGLPTVELFTPTSVAETDANFAFSQEPVPSPCADGIADSCVRMSAARFAHAALAIDGSATWLNGSVVFAGGGPGTFPEIYVPAWQCAGTVPVRFPDASPMDGVDFCDRGHALVGLTDPLAPSPVGP